MSMNIQIYLDLSSIGKHESMNVKLIGMLLKVKRFIVPTTRGHSYAIPICPM